MQKLKVSCINNDPSFYHLYQITIEKIRRFYHSINGLPKINTSKIYKVYKNDDYPAYKYMNQYQLDEVISTFYKGVFDSLLETSKDTLDKNIYV